MTLNESGTDGHGTDASRRFRFDLSLITDLQRDVDITSAAGDRLAAGADPNAVPLPVVLLASTVGDSEQQ